MSAIAHYEIQKSGSFGPNNNPRASSYGLTNSMRDPIFSSDPYHIFPIGIRQNSIGTVVTIDTQDSANTASGWASMCFSGEGWNQPVSGEVGTSVQTFDFNKSIYSLLNIGFYVSEYDFLPVFEYPVDHINKAISDFIESDCMFPYREKLSKRLHLLKELANEENDQSPMSLASIIDFISFFRSNNGLACPSLVLTRDGHIRAEWRANASRRLAIEFMGERLIRFVIFIPDPDRSSKINYHTGRISLQTFLNTVKMYDVPLWRTM